MECGMDSEHNKGKPGSIALGNPNIGRLPSRLQSFFFFFYIHVRYLHLKTASKTPWIPGFLPEPWNRETQTPSRKPRTQTRSDTEKLSCGNWNANSSIDDHWYLCNYH